MWAIFNFTCFSSSLQKHDEQTTGDCQNRPQFTLSWLKSPPSLRHFTSLTKCIFPGWHVSKHPICLTKHRTFYMFFPTSLTFTNKKFSPEQTGAKAGMQKGECEKISQGGRKSKILGLFDFCLSAELIRRPHCALCQINLPLKTFLPLLLLLHLFSIVIVEIAQVFSNQSRLQIDGIEKKKQDIEAHLPQM